MPLDVSSPGWYLECPHCGELHEREDVLLASTRCSRCGYDGGLQEVHVRPRVPTRRLRRADWDVLHVLHKCGGEATMLDVVEDTGLLPQGEWLKSLRPWVSATRAGLRLTGLGRITVREEAARYVQ